MMKTEKILLERVNYLINLANTTLSTMYISGGHFQTRWVNGEIYNEFESSCLSFIMNLYGKDHPYYTTFITKVNGPHPSNVETARGILSSIKREIENGWLNTIKGLLSAEIFTDFIETAEHLLQQNYKDPVAVIIGSTLEEHLRQLCRKYNIDVEENVNSKKVPRRADSLNADLSKANVYSKLDLKNVTAWLDLRNKAAHGKYSEYTKEQVEIMLQGILDFMNRNHI